MSEAKVWGIRAGEAGEADEIFLDAGQIALSYADCGPEVAELPNSKEAFTSFIAATPSGLARPASVPIRAGQLHRFVHELQIGDHVIYPRRADRTLHWGEVFGPYEFRHSSSLSPSLSFGHRRRIHWWKTLSRDFFSHGALYELGSGLTFFEVRSFAEEFRQRFDSDTEPEPVEAISDPTARNIVHDIGETTLDFISKRLRATLKGFPMEVFIADLFRAMGYNTRVTARRRDQGVDVLAHRDELGIEPPILKIQVKSNDEPVGADAVKAFSANIQQQEIGIVATTAGFSGSAMEFAKGRTNLRLIDGTELVELVQKHYDGMSAHSRRLLPLRRILVPDLAFDLE